METVFLTRVSSKLAINHCCMESAPCYNSLGSRTKEEHSTFGKGEIHNMEIASMEDYELEKIITEVMLDVGIPAHLKGYHYLRNAILMSGRNMEIVSSVTKLLYPAIARHYRTTGQKVERAIRNAIEVSWIRGNNETFEKIFGYSSSSGMARPTNSEYIARLADKIRLDVKTM